MKFLSFKMSDGSNVWIAPGHVASVLQDPGEAGCSIRTGDGRSYAVTADAQSTIADLTLAMEPGDQPC